MISVHTRSLCVIYMLDLCTSYLLVQHCIKKTPLRSSPPTKRDTVEIRAALLGRPPSAGPPRHWVGTKYTHARANEAYWSKVQYSRITTSGWICGLRHMGYMIIWVTWTSEWCTHTYRAYSELIKIAMLAVHTLMSIHAVDQLAACHKIHCLNDATSRKHCLHNDTSWEWLRHHNNHCRLESKSNRLRTRYGYLPMLTLKINTHSVLLESKKFACERGTTTLWFWP